MQKARKSLGFLEPAFRLAPDPRFFYASRQYQEAFLALRYGIKLRTGVMVLTGESGTGKTSLIQMVKERCESNIHISELSSFAQPSSAFLTRLMQAVGILTSSQDRQEILRELRRYLVQQLMQGHNVAVVLDGAHELDLESFKELELVLKLRWDQKNLLQIVLTGTPALKTKLQDSALESFSKSVALWYRVEPLPAQEVGRYIQHRLSCAGYAGEGLFLAGAMERIAAYSRGIPGLVNVLCKKALEFAHAASSDRVSAEVVDQAWQALQRTGESEFEVAALLSEIRLYSSCAADPSINTSYKQGSRARPMEQFGLEERRSGTDDQRARGLGEKFAWLRTFQEVIGRNAIRSFRKLRLFAERERKPISTATVRLMDLGRARSSSRWFNWSALIVIVSLTGSVMLSEWLGAGPNSSTRMTSQTRGKTEHGPGLAQQGAEMPRNVQRPTAGLQPLQHANQVTELQDAAENTVNAHTSSILIESSEEKDRTAKNESSGRVVYVHTSGKRDLPVIEEFQDALRTSGYDVRNTRFSRNATQGDVRFFFPGDRRDAVRIKSLLQSELGRHGYSLTLQLLERDGKKFEHARPGKIEVWLPPLADTRATG